MRSQITFNPDEWVADCEISSRAGFGRRPSSPSISRAAHFLG
jgi:hypothetical protein